ncbi:MAG: ketopantoate reductase family protein [Proteobacteria bacterium]|nr:ketopantoate reductase family protein [Pseudomonadota bacterium]
MTRESYPSETTAPERVAVIGAGAVGLAVGQALAGVGAQVVFAIRRGSDAAWRRHGILRTGALGESRSAPDDFAVCDGISALRGHFDAILVCTKTFASAEVCRALAEVWPQLAGPRRVVLFHNGWGSADVFRAAFGVESVFSARVITGFVRKAPHWVDVTVHADAIHVGSLFGADPSTLAWLAAALSSGGLPCAPAKDIARDLLAKLLYNCALNPLGALRGVPYGVLGESAATRAVMDAVLDEVFDVLGANGLSTHWARAEDYRRVFYDELLPATAEHESSMLQDLRAGRETEIESLSGAVERLGQDVGVETPVNAALAALVRAARSGPSDG